MRFIYERALRITYQDNTSTFYELLGKDISISINYRNLQVLATQMFEILLKDTSKRCQVHPA